MRINKENIYLTIITVCYNSQDTIERTIDSVLKIKNSEIEYLIIDGKSIDSTLKIINKYNDKIDLLISEKDSGIYDAMNKGINKANGRFITFLNSDDFYNTNEFLKYYNEIKSIDKDYIYHSNIYNMKNNVILEKVYPRFSLSKMKYIGMTLNHPTFIVPNYIYKKFKFDQKFKILSDYKFTLITMLCNVEYFYLNFTVVNYSIEGESSNFNQRIIEGYLIRKQIFGYGNVLIFSSIFRITYGILSYIKNKINNYLI